MDIPLAPGGEPWSLKYDDPHEHYWSAWAGIYRGGHEICLQCGISILEDWEIRHGLR